MPGDFSSQQPLVSVIVPSRDVSDYLYYDLLPALSAQTYDHFELLVVLDHQPERELPDWVRVIVPDMLLSPPEKRDLAADQAQGEILAFLDDDAFPKPDWLQQAVDSFDQDTAAVCGPGFTPDSDSLLSKVSGWFWQSFWGGGPTLHRNRLAQDRLVDDYPSFNFLVRKSDFEAVNGFDCNFWPGEDTKLCLALTQDLGKNICYSPRIQVFHHRRDIFGPHLRQAGRYGRQRGRFARIYPETSAKPFYFLPSVLVLGLLAGVGLSLILPWAGWLLAASLLVYLSLVLINAGLVAVKASSVLIAALLVPTTIITHCYYGLKFIQGFLFPERGLNTRKK